jgi:hypothetical protein
MRKAAMLQEWDRVISTEQERCGLVADLKSLDAGVKLDESERSHKDQLIRKILADDAETRSLTEAWISQLQASMKNNQQEQRLLKAYRA